MGETKGKEAIVEGDEGKRGWNSVNQDKDTRLAKRGKVEEGKGDGTQEEEEEEGEANDKVGRLRRLLRRLLKDEPTRLTNKETEVVIRYLDVDDIISWASKSGEVKEKENEGYMYLDLEAGNFVPSPEKVGRLMMLMLLCGVEKLKAVDLYILYNNFAKAAFASMLLHALDSYSKRHLDGGRSLYPWEMRVNIKKACSVLSWKLLAHVMYKLTSLPVFKCTISTATSTRDEQEEEDDEIQGKGVENCDICYGKGKHSGVYGYYCSYWQYVPGGATIGPTHYGICRKCCCILRRRGTTFARCSCGSLEGKAVPCSILWDGNI